MALGPAVEVKNVTAAGTVKSTDGYVWGLVVSKAAVGTLVTIRDGGATGTIRITIPVASLGTGVPINFAFPVPVRFLTDIYATPGGNDLAVLYE